MYSAANIWSVLKNCIDFLWSTRSVTQFFSSPRRSWTIIPHAISYICNIIIKIYTVTAHLFRRSISLQYPKMEACNFRETSVRQGNPTLWNLLRLTVRQASPIESFEIRLKNHLSHKAFREVIDSPTLKPIVHYEQQLYDPNPTYAFVSMLIWWKHKQCSENNQYSTNDKTQNCDTPFVINQFYYIKMVENMAVCVTWHLC